MWGFPHQQPIWFFLPDAELKEKHLWGHQRYSLISVRITIILPVFRLRNLECKVLKAPHSEKWKDCSFIAQRPHGVPAETLPWLLWPVSLYLREGPGRSETSPHVAPQGRASGELLAVNILPITPIYLLICLNITTASETSVVLFLLGFASACATPIFHRLPCILSNCRCSNISASSHWLPLELPERNRHLHKVIHLFHLKTISRWDLLKTAISLHSLERSTRLKSWALTNF